MLLEFQVKSLLLSFCERLASHFPVGRETITNDDRSTQLAQSCSIAIFAILQEKGERSAVLGVWCIVTLLKQTPTAGTHWQEKMRRVSSLTGDKNFLGCTSEVVSKNLQDGTASRSSCSSQKMRLKW